MYDANRNVTQVTDANAHVTTYTFDFDNEVTQEVDASGTASARTIGTGYDANGNVTTQTDALSHVTTYAYDVLNRRVSTTDALSRVARLHLRRGRDRSPFSGPPSVRVPG